MTVSASYTDTAAPWPFRPSKVPKSKAIRSLACIFAGRRSEPRAHRYAKDGRDGCNGFAYAVLRVLACECVCHERRAA